jgi:hypothetical protein
MTVSTITTVEDVHREMSDDAAERANDLAVTSAGWSSPP